MRQRQEQAEPAPIEDIYSTDEDSEDNQDDFDVEPESATVLLKEDLHAQIFKPQEKAFKSPKPPQKQRMDPQTVLNLMEIRMATARQLDATLICPLCFIRGFDMKHPAVECPDLDNFGFVSE